VIAFDESDVRALLQDLEADQDIELLSKTAITEQGVPHSMLAPVDRLFEDLTDRQLAALQLALEQGYYEQPRERRSENWRPGRPSPARRTKNTSGRRRTSSWRTPARICGW